MKGIVAFFVGVTFALGLGISGMTQPHIVRSFLDVFGDWDHRLLFVMVGAISVHALLYHFIVKRKSPVLEEKFYLPENKKITAKLIWGAAIFGIGWGWSGICPGPGIVALMSFKKEFLIFLISMILGMKVFQKFIKIS